MAWLQFRTDSHCVYITLWVLTCCLVTQIPFIYTPCRLWGIPCTAAAYVWINWSHGWVDSQGLSQEIASHIIGSHHAKDNFSCCKVQRKPQCLTAVLSSMKSLELGTIWNDPKCASVVWFVIGRITVTELKEGLWGFSPIGLCSKLMDVS